MAGILVRAVVVCLAAGVFGGVVGGHPAVAQDLPSGQGLPEYEYKPSLWEQLKCRFQDCPPDVTSLPVGPDAYEKALERQEGDDDFGFEPQATPDGELGGQAGDDPRGQAGADRLQTAAASCTAAKTSLGDALADQQAANHRAWGVEGDALYKRYQTKIRAERAALHAQTQSRLEGLLHEAQRAPIRREYLDEQRRILGQWSDYHEQRGTLDYRYRQRHFALHAAWVDAVGALRTRNGC